MPIDYSNWKKIEVSDDEDDTLERVDKPSLFRWRHQSRLEKMAEFKREQDELKRRRQKVEKCLAESKERLEQADLEEADREKLSTEMSELSKEMNAILEKDEVFKKKEEQRPWNVDTIGKTGFNKTRINKIVTRELPSTATLREIDWKEKLEKFYVDNQSAIRQYGTLVTLEETEKFLLEHPHLVCDETATCLATECLSLEMQEKPELVQRVAAQTTVINYLLELAARLKRPRGNAEFISMVLGKMKKAHAEQQDASHGFKADVQSFVDLIVEQLKEKKAEQNKQKKEEEERKKKEEDEQRSKRLGPGGLDPLEVLKTLPEEMRCAFEQKDLTILKRLAEEMPVDEFSELLQRCIDSGLWVPSNNDNNSVEVVNGQDVNMPLPPMVIDEITDEESISPPPPGDSSEKQTERETTTNDGEGEPKMEREE